METRLLQLSKNEPGKDSKSIPTQKTVFLVHYKDMLSSHGENINPNTLDLILTNLTKLIADCPEQELAALEMLFEYYKINPQFKIFRLLQKNDDIALKVTDYLREKFITYNTILRFMHNLEDCIKGAKNCLSFLNLLETIADYANNPLICFHAYKNLIICYSAIGWHENVLKARYDHYTRFAAEAFWPKDASKTPPIYWLQKAKTTYKIIEKLAAQLNIEFKDPKQIQLYRQCYKADCNFENSLDLISLGDIDEILRVGDSEKNSAPQRALQLYLWGMEKAFETKDIPLIVSIRSKIYYIKKSSYLLLSADEIKTIEETFLRINREPEILKYDYYNPPLLKEHLQIRSETIDPLITELSKKNSYKIWFICFAEDCYTTKLNAEGLTAAERKLLDHYTQSKISMKETLKTLPADIKLLENNLTDAKREKGNGQQLRDWIQNYIKTYKIEIDSSPFEILKADLPQFVAQIIEFDCVALLDIRNANEAAIALQNKMIAALLNEGNNLIHAWLKINFSSLNLSKDDENRIKKLAESCYYLMNLCSTLALLNQESPFYALTKPARDFSNTFRELINQGLAIKSESLITNDASDAVWRPAFSRLLNCPAAIAKKVLKEVPNESSSIHLGIRTRLALMASAHILVLAKNRNLKDEIETTYHKYLLRSGTKRRFVNTEMQNGYISNLIVTMTSDLKKASARALAFLTLRAKSESDTTYSQLAKLLLEFISEAEQPVYNATIYLWVKMSKAPVKPYVRDAFIKGLFKFISTTKWDYTPLQEKLFTDALDCFAEADIANFSKLILPSAPVLEVKAATKPVVLEVEGKLTVLESVSGPEGKPAAKPSAPELEIKPVATPSAPELEIKPMAEPSAPPMLDSVRLEFASVSVPLKQPALEIQNSNPPVQQEIKQIPAIAEVLEIKEVITIAELPRTPKIAPITEVPSPQQVAPIVELSAIEQTTSTTKSQELKRVSVQLNTTVQPLSPITLTSDRIEGELEKHTLEDESTSLDPEFEIEPGSCTTPFFKANIEIDEPIPGILSITANFISSIPTPIAFAIYTTHLLLEHHAVTPVKLVDPCIYFDAPPCLFSTSTSAQTKISVHLRESKEHDFKIISTTINTPKITPAQLDLTLFSHKKTVSQNAPLTSHVMVKNTPNS